MKRGSIYENTSHPGSGKFFHLLHFPVEQNVMVPDNDPTHPPALPDQLHILGDERCHSNDRIGDCLWGVCGRGNLRDRQTYFIAPKSQEITLFQFFGTDEVRQTWMLVLVCAHQF